MADDLLNPGLPPVSWTAGTAARENRPEAGDPELGEPKPGQPKLRELKLRELKKRAGEKNQKRKQRGPRPSGEAAETIEGDEHEIDSFA